MHLRAFKTPSFTGLTSPIFLALPLCHITSGQVRSGECILRIIWNNVWNNSGVTLTTLLYSGLERTVHIVNIEWVSDGAISERAIVSGRELYSVCWRTNESNVEGQRRSNPVQDWISDFSTRTHPLYYIWWLPGNLSQESGKWLNCVRLQLSKTWWGVRVCVLGGRC